MLDYEVITVTPKLAGEMLATSLVNRRLTQNRVDEWVAEMTAGRWYVGQTLMTDVDGHLVDGHHRLRAVQLYGKPVKFAVQRNIPVEVWQALDIGRPRSFADVLAMRDVGSPTHVAPVVTALLRYERYVGVSHFTAGCRFSPYELMDEYQRCRDEIMEGLRVGEHILKTNVRFPRTLGAVLYIVLARLDEEKASEFFDLLADGIGSMGSAWPITKKDPVYMLRQALIEDAIDRRVRKTGAMSDMYRAALVFKAWNAWIAGNEIGVLRFRLVGPTPESFPEPVMETGTPCC
jgi:hypothetical protein